MIFILFLVITLSSIGAQVSAATPDMETTRRAVEAARGVYRALSESGKILGIQGMSALLVDGFLQKFWWEESASSTYLDLLSSTRAIDVNSDLANGRTILHALAIEGGQNDIEMVQLFTKYTDTKLDVIDDIEGDSPIELAARSDNLVVVKAMLPARGYSEDEYKKLLQLAVENNNAEMVGALVEYGYSKRHEDKQLATYPNLFLGEAWETEVNVAEIIIKHGGDPNYKKPVEKLVKRYAGVPSDHWDGSWHWFSHEKWQEAEPLRQPIYNQVKTLLERGADLSKSPYILDNIMDREMTFLLLEHGAKLDHKRHLNQSLNFSPGNNSGWSIIVRDGVMSLSDSDDGTLFHAYLEAQKQEAILERLEKTEQQ